jgi:ATP-binding cassette subfamily F protein 3
MNSLARYEFEAIPKHIQILLVEQEIEGNEKNPLELVLETDGERQELLDMQAKLGDSDDPNSSQKLTEIYVRLEQIDAASAESRACTRIHTSD